MRELRLSGIRLAYGMCSYPFVMAIPHKLEPSPLYNPSTPSRLTMSLTASYVVYSQSVSALLERRMVLFTLFSFLVSTAALVDRKIKGLAYRPSVDVYNSVYGNE